MKKQRTIYNADGTVTKVHPEYEVSPGVFSIEEPTAWESVVIAFKKWIRGIFNR